MSDVRYPPINFMRPLGIFLFFIWCTVALHLVALPPSVLKSELDFHHQFLAQVEGADTRIQEIPQIKYQIESSKAFLANPAPRERIIWAKWLGLLMLVLIGLIAAYATIRRDKYAMLLMLVSSMLFLIRQVVFHRAVYSLLVEGWSPLGYLLKHGHSQLVINTIWYDFVIPALFMLLTLLVLFRGIQSWAKREPPLA